VTRPCCLIPRDLSSCLYRRDDDNYAKPHEVRTFATAMTRGGADILTSFVQFFWSAESPLAAAEVNPKRLTLYPKP
jgi:hypothetical protein